MIHLNQGFYGRAVAAGGKSRKDKNKTRKKNTKQENSEKHTLKSIKKR
jgi:hypothetical protein